jgi:Flp pilus assembly protein TadB
VIATRARTGILGGLVLLILAVPGLSAAAPAGDTNAKISNIKSQPGLVQFVFSAGNLAGGDTLNPKSIVVSVDGKTLPATASPAQVIDASVGAPLREVILTLDVSGSMQGAGIAAARSAAVTYARSLPPDVRVGLVTFSDVPHTLLAATVDRAALKATIGTVRAGGNTALYDGVVAAADTMRRLPRSSVRRLVILSDGDDTSSKHSLADATTSLVTGGIAADVVAFRLPGDRSALNSIALRSHGRVLPASSAGGLAAAFKTAAQAFKQQVLVTVQVPDTLAGRPVHLMASATAGSHSVTGTVALTMPGVRKSTGGSTPQAVGVPAVAASTTALWLIVGVAFVAIFGVAMLVLWAPMGAGAKAGKQARLAEVSRYRLRGAIGYTPQPAAPTPTQSTLTTSALSFVDKTVRARGQRDRLVDELDRSGLRMRPEEWVVVQVIVVVFVAALIAVLTHSPIGILLGGVLGWVGARVFIRTKISRRATAFVDQLPDTLQLIAGSLRSGFSLGQALTGVVREGTEPTASEFARAMAEVRLGSELEDALDGVADRMRCEDLRWVVMAVRISREVGGNLAEVLNNTVSTMRDRAQLRGQVRVLSAEGRISAKVLIGLPFMLATYLLLFKKGYLDPLFNTGTGIALLVVGSTLLLLGAFWLSRLVKIEV